MHVFSTMAYDIKSHVYFSICRGPVCSTGSTTNTSQCSIHELFTKQEIGHTRFIELYKSTSLILSLFHLYVSTNMQTLYVCIILFIQICVHCVHDHCINLCLKFCSLFISSLFSSIHVIHPISYVFVFIVLTPVCNCVYVHQAPFLKLFSMCDSTMYGHWIFI